MRRHQREQPARLRFPGGEGELAGEPDRLAGQVHPARVAGRVDEVEHRAARRMESVRRALRRCAVIIFLRAAPCRDESRDRASANRSPESFINGLVFTLKGLTLAR